MVRFFLYSVQIQEKVTKDNSVFGHFSRSATLLYYLRVLKLHLQYYMLLQFFYKLSICEPKNVPTNTRLLSFNKKLK